MRTCECGSPHLSRMNERTVESKMEWKRDLSPGVRECGLGLCRTLIFPVRCPGRIWHLGISTGWKPVATTSSGLIPRSFLMSCCEDMSGRLRIAICISSRYKPAGAAVISQSALSTPGSALRRRSRRLSRMESPSAVSDETSTSISTVAGFHSKGEMASR